jgi:hypothetical protein
MQLCLVSASTATDFEDPGEAAGGDVRLLAARPPLGVLTLAAVLRRQSVSCGVFNLNRLYYDYLADGGSGVEGFAGYAAERMLASGAQLYGFGTLCSSYPLTIRIAARLKRADPAAAILLGGPQASAVDVATLAAFPFVDFILRGEADETLPRFWTEWCGAGRMDRVEGLTWRGAGGPVRNAPAPIVEDLDSLPLPAYELDGGLGHLERAPLEVGRGCPFSCTFCSTSDFFRRRFRLKSPPRVLADMRAIASRYGLRRFDLTHDMFTVDRRRVFEFCEHLAASGAGFEWACSARTDCVDQELLERMSASGCTAMFFGIESGSPRMQRTIGKNLDLTDARKAISLAQRIGIATDVALIAGFPEESEDDLRRSLDIFAHSMRHPRSTPQLNLLAPLAGTAIHARYREQLVLEELCSDISHQGRTQNEADRELIRQHPDIFPNFYMAPSPGLDRAACLELREFLLMGLGRLRWLLAALPDTGTAAFLSRDQRERGLLDVFHAWRARRSELHPGLSGGELRSYYTTEASAREFVRFVRRRPAVIRTAAVEALLCYYEALAETDARDALLPRTGSPLPRAFRPSDRPVRARQIHVFELGWDVQSAIDCVKGTGTVPRRRPMLYRTAPISRGQVRLLEISPLLYRALELCDGSLTIGECVEALSRCFRGPREARRYGSQCVLRRARSQRLVEIYRAPAPTRRT